jgi:hypothetical protein
VSYCSKISPDKNPFAVKNNNNNNNNNNSFQFSIYLRVEVNSRWPITEATWNVKQTIKQQTNQNTHKKKKTKGKKG